MLHQKILETPYKTRYGNFIGGEWREPVDGRYFDNTTPVTGGKLCEVARSSEKDVELALDAAHAAKVLLKFKLLELQEVEFDEFVAWAERAAYFRVVHRRWYSDQPWREWTRDLLEGLIESGAAAREGTRITNA